MGAELTTNDWDEKTLGEVRAMGQLGYTVERALLVLTVEDEERFRRDWNDPASALHKAYRRGKAQADYQVDRKLFEQARNGDTVALQELERRKRLHQEEAAEEEHRAREDRHG